MQSAFGSLLLRLKEQLDAPSDKDVAAVLNMSPTAFNDRKKRESFPEDRLIALSVKRPDLGLDVGYILTGERRDAWERDMLQKTSAAALAVEPSGDGPIGKKLIAAYKDGAVQMQNRNRNRRYGDLQMVLDSCEDEDLEVIFRLAFRLALKSKGERSTTPSRPSTSLGGGGGGAVKRIRPAPNQQEGVRPRVSKKKAA